jgi:hypothetical protein
MIYIYKFLIMMSKMNPVRRCLDEIYSCIKREDYEEELRKLCIR